MKRKPQSKELFNFESDLASNKIVYTDFRTNFQRNLQKDVERILEM